LGRGRSSGLGKTSGRGHKGDKARTGGGARTYFEGGQTNFFKRLRKFGFNNGKFRKTFEPLNLNKLQVWIDTGRIDPNKKITMKVRKSFIVYL
jgi:large subunit ribosomal protein L15